ncbi:Echinoderm microtubule-associated protein-like 1 [Hymenolepis weldensis]
MYQQDRQLHRYNRDEMVRERAEILLRIHPNYPLIGLERLIPLRVPGIDLLNRYGYRGRDCRNNVYLLPTGEIIYFIAAVVVLYNLEQHSQRHYLEHNDDIKW